MISGEGSPRSESEAKRSARGKSAEASVGARVQALCARFPLYRAS